MNPFRQMQGWRERIGNLQQQPADDEVDSGYLEYTAALEFIE